MIRQSIFYMMMATSLMTNAQNKTIPIVKWKRVADLPPSFDHSKSLGFAGAINGISDNILVVAGGANFPDRLPWDGGKKYYSNEIHILQKKNEKYFWKKNVAQQLPQPIAYCGNTSTSKGIVYAGGENEKGISDKCFLLKWDAVNDSIEVLPLPDLPLALTNIALTHIANTVYAAGGDESSHSSRNFFSLNLDDANATWKHLPDLPVALANATLIAQGPQGKENIYLIGGRSKTASGISELHATTYVFNLKKNDWQKCADINDGKNISNLSAAAGIAIDKNLILMVGGDNGKTFHKIETYISRISKSNTKEEKEKLTSEKNALSIHHKGFFKGLLLYNIQENTWTNIGDYPFPAQVTTTAVKWGNNIVISNGEIKPGVRTPSVVIGLVK